MNIEHPTSNGEWEEQKTSKEGINGFHSMFGVQSSMLDVHLLLFDLIISVSSVTASKSLWEKTRWRFLHKRKALFHKDAQDIQDKNQSSLMVEKHPGAPVHPC